MKITLKYCIVILSCFILSTDGNAQRNKLEEGFHNSHLNNNGLAALYAIDDELNGGFIWNVDYKASAYVRMAEHLPIASRQKQYYDIAIAHFEHLLDNRDDFDTSRPLGLRQDVRNRIMPWWINNSYTEYDEPIAFVGHDGQFTYPMVYFAKSILTSTNTALKNTVYHTPSSRPAIYNSISYDNKTYEQIALDLIERVDETVAAHMAYHWEQWEIGNLKYGTFMYDENLSGDPIRVYNGSCYNYGPYEPYNLHSSMGRTILMMHECLDYLNDFRAPTYLDRTERMGTYQVSKLTTNPDGGYQWTYSNEANEILDAPHCHCSGGCKQTRSEDIGHAFLVGEFLFLLHEYDIKYSYNNANLFSTSDMTKLAQAFNRMYVNPGQYEIDIYDYSGNGVTASTNWADHIQFVPHSSQFSEWNHNLYHRGYDEYMSRILSGTLSQFHMEGVTKMYQSAIANDFLFHGMAVNRAPNYISRWTGVSGGDFDGDGRDEEFIGVRNYDGGFHLLKYDLSMDDAYRENMYTVASYTGFGNSSDWNDVAAGDFDGDNIDEFVGVRNFDGDFHMLEYDGSNIVGVPGGSYTAYGSASNWAGICAGNFDPSTPEDEFAAVRNYDGQLVIFRYNGSIVGVPGGTEFTGITNWTDLSAGDFDNDGKDEIIGVTGSGEMHLFKYQSGTVNPLAINLTYPLYPSGIYNVTVGDYDRNKIDDEIVFASVDGEIRVLKITFDQISRGTEYWSLTQIHEEKQSADYFQFSVGLGTASLAKVGCSYDKLVMLRNSNLDADMFIYDVGLDLDNSWQCQVKGTKRIGQPEEESNQKISGLQLSPNPSNDVVQVTITGDLINGEVTLMNLSGVVVKMNEITESRGAINVEDVSPGVYLVVVKSERGELYTERLVVK